MACSRAAIAGQSTQSQGQYQGSIDKDAEVGQHQGSIDIDSSDSSRRRRPWPTTTD